jgi:hypothetical protein
MFQKNSFKNAVIFFAFAAMLWAYTPLKAQDFSVDEQYIQAMQNAKAAFEAQHYSEAVMFYKEAQRLKPNQLLPRYKIEDIRTIYIKKEMDTLQQVQIAAVPASVKKPSKKEQALRDAEFKQQAEAEATRKMEADAQQALAIIVAEPKPENVKVIEIDEEPVTEPDNIDIKPIEPSRQTGMAPITKHDAKPLETKPTTAQITATPRPVPVIETTVDTTPAKAIEPTPKPKSQSQPVADTKPAQPTQEWVAAEQKRLAEKYPNKKTVEEIEQPGKKITRVVMNVDSKVLIYLKVQHSWGATFFFLDETGQALRSINEQYFNVMTNLDTYGY